MAQATSFVKWGQNSNMGENLFFNRIVNMFMKLSKNHRPWAIKGKGLGGEGCGHKRLKCFFSFYSTARGR